MSERWPRNKHPSQCVGCVIASSSARFALAALISGPRRLSPWRVTSRAATRTARTGLCWRHGATSVVNWDALTSASLCKKAHSYAGVQGSVGPQPLMPVAILGGRLAALRGSDAPISCRPNPGAARPSLAYSPQRVPSSVEPGCETSAAAAMADVSGAACPSAQATSHATAPSWARAAAR